MSTSPEVNLWPSAEHALDYLRWIIPSSSVDARALPRLVDVIPSRPWCFWRRSNRGPATALRCEVTRASLAAISEGLSVCGDACGGLSADADRQENHLWQLLQRGLHGTVILEFVGVLQGVLFFTARALVVWQPILGGVHTVFPSGSCGLVDWLAHAWQERRAAILAWSATAALTVWNLGLMFQWGMHLIPDRGPIVWRDAAYNQVTLVPAQACILCETIF